MKKILGFIGLALFGGGIVLDVVWYKLSLPLNSSFDGTGPGLCLSMPGFILLLRYSSGYLKKFSFGILWFFVFFLIGIIITTILGSFIHSYAVIEKISRLMGVGSFMLAVWGALTGRLPGTKTQEKIL